MTHPLIRIPSARAAALALLLGGCTRAPVARPRTLDARLIMLAPDTVVIRAQATAQRCDRGGVLLLGIDGGSGVLLWTDGEARSGDYPVISRGDTVGRGAKVSVRFMNGEVGRGVSLDSGSVTLSVEGDRVSAHVRGSGLEPGSGVRATLIADFKPLRLGRDTASCR
jgi:hypothetical protein